MRPVLNYFYMNQNDIPQTARILLEVIKGPEKKWVLFEHDTCVFVENTGGDLATTAKDILQKRGLAHGGSDSGDFSVMELKFHAGWVVSFNDPNILTYVGMQDVTSDNPSQVGVGVIGRAKYNADVTGLRVVYAKDR